MNYLGLTLKCTILSGMIIASQQSWAKCSSSNPNSYSRALTTTALTVSRTQANGPIGSIIAINPQGPTASVSCTGKGIQMLKLETTLTPSDYDSSVYKTNIPGIGVKIWNDWALSSGWAGAQVVTLSNSLQHWYSWSGSSGGNYLTDIKLQFYVIGPVTAGNVELKTPTVGAYSNTSISEAGAVRYSALSITGPVQIKVRACKTPDIFVDLGKHKRSEFTGVNSTTAATSFNFAINDCDPGMNSVNYTFKPATGISVGGSGATQHITLDNDSSASGVGIQVLYASGALVPLNQKTTFTGYNKNINGSYTIPMKARYIQTATDTSGGKANSAIEFTMSYE